MGKASNSAIFAPQDMDGDVRELRRDEKNV